MKLHGLADFDEVGHGYRSFRLVDLQNISNQKITVTKFFAVFADRNPQVQARLQNSLLAGR